MIVQASINHLQVDAKFVQYPKSIVIIAPAYTYQYPSYIGGPAQRTQYQDILLLSNKIISIIICVASIFHMLVSWVARATWSWCVLFERLR